MDFLIQQKMQDIHLIFITNLSRLQFKKHNVLDYWKQFPNLEVLVSIDDIGPRAEYFRKGSNWTQLLENLTQLKQALPHITLKAHITISAFNVFYIPETLHYLILKKLFEPQRIHSTFLYNPVFANIQVLPMEFKDRIRNILSDFMNKDHSWMAKEDITHIKTLIQSIITFMDSGDLTEYTPYYQAYIDKMDRHWGDDFATVYPEMADIMDWKNP